MNIISSIVSVCKNNAYLIRSNRSKYSDQSDRWTMKIADRHITILNGFTDKIKLAPFAFHAAIYLKTLSYADKVFKF